MFSHENFTWFTVSSKCKNGSTTQDSLLREFLWMFSMLILVANLVVVCFTSWFPFAMLPSVRMPRGTPISSWLHLSCIELLLHLIIAMSNQEMNVGRHILGKDLSPQIKSSPDTTFLKYISCKEIYLAFCLNFSTSWNSELLTAFNNSHMLRSKASGTPKMLADTEELRNTLISQSAYM